MEYVYIVEDWIDNEVIVVCKTKEQALNFCKAHIERLYENDWIDTDISLDEYYRQLEEEGYVEDIVAYRAVRFFN